MELNFFCPRWGCENLSWDDFLQKVKAAGFDGVEYGIASELTVEELATIVEKTASYDLLLIAQHYDTYEADFKIHLTKYAEWFEKIKHFSFYSVNSQTGKDFFTIDQNRQIITIAENYTAATGIAVYHETHRNKFAFAAHVTKVYLDAIAALELTFDVSHWVNVAESWLEDQPEAVGAAIARAGHIHARVGFPEGPQVPDPRVPEWQDALNRHMAWWDKIVKRKQAKGDAITITPEFGPSPYMVHLPSTGEAICNQWDVNVYMMDLLRKRYHHLL